jgi:hypothetical protein
MQAPVLRPEQPGHDGQLRVQGCELTNFAILKELKAKTRLQSKTCPKNSELVANANLVVDIKMNVEWKFFGHFLSHVVAY